jgi:PTH1 family peptidyl-tRNA hydrolase
VKLIAGLGNPGPRYRETRHNVGFEVLDELAARARVAFGTGPADALVARVRDPGRDTLLAKPLTFMNLSGRAVGELARYYRIDVGDLLVVTDDVNLPAGRLRLRRGGSAGGHNGLKSIIDCLGSDAFPRLRVGVGRGDTRRDLADHVLARMAPDERDTLREAALRAADACEMFITEGIDAAMNRFNRDPEDASRPPEAQ